MYRTNSLFYISTVAEKSQRFPLVTLNYMDGIWLQFIESKGLIRLSPICSLCRNINDSALMTSQTTTEHSSWGREWPTRADIGSGEKHSLVNSRMEGDARKRTLRNWFLCVCLLLLIIFMPLNQNINQTNTSLKTSTPRDVKYINKLEGDVIQNFIPLLPLVRRIDSLSINSSEKSKYT